MKIECKYYLEYVIDYTSPNSCLESPNPSNGVFRGRGFERECHLDEVMRKGLSR